MMMIMLRMMMVNNGELRPLAQTQLRPADDHMVNDDDNMEDDDDDDDVILDKW